MPCFSKPAALATLALIAASTAVPIDTLPWSACGNFQCGDLYFCCTSNDLYGYTKAAGAPCLPGAGPTIRMTPGRNYNLTIHNTCEGTVDPVTGMSSNSTNLHFHGLHSSGEGNNDNVLRQLDPGNCIMQNYFLQSDLAPGNNWYHPHLHMLVLRQAGGGAFGQVVIEGAPPGTYDSKVAKFFTNPAVERQLMVTSTGLANGDVRGTQISLVKDQWHYFEVLHVIPTGSAYQPASFLPTAVKSCEVYELSADGVFYSKVPFTKYGSPVYSWTVHAAQRLGLAVKCSKVGKFAAYKFAGNTVASFVVSDTTKPGDETPFTNGKQQWASSRPNYIADLRNGKYPSAVKVVNDTFPIVLGDDMTINGIQWNLAISTAYFPYGNKYIQEFKVSNSDSHPWHMHQQHFQVVQKGGCAPVHKEGEWYDSIASTGDCLVRTRFVDFTGKIVHHCHDLEHEDAGMMSWFGIPFAAPGSFEASSLFAPVTPQYSCAAVAVAPSTVVVAAAGTTTTASTSGATPVGAVAASSSTGSIAISSPDSQCPAAPIYPWVIMGVSIAVAVLAVSIAIYMVRRNAAKLLYFEELKVEQTAPVFATTAPSLGMSPARIEQL